MLMRLHVADAVLQRAHWDEKSAAPRTQAFNLFYHHRDNLTEGDAAKKKFLLQLSRLVEVRIVASLALLGMASLEKM